MLAASDPVPTRAGHVLAAAMSSSSAKLLLHRRGINSTTSKQAIVNLGFPTKSPDLSICGRKVLVSSLRLINE